MASKTIDHMDFYVAIAGYQLPSVPDQTFNCLRVSVGYRKGSGFYASFHPGWGDGSMWGCAFDFSKDPLSAGMTEDVDPATKNSAKRIAEMTESLKMAKDIIAALFDDRDWEKLKNVLQNVARFGYTEGFKEQAEKYLAARVSKRYEKAVKPIESKSNENNNQNSTIMAQNVKAADLIGKVIVIGGTSAKYIVKSIDGDKLACDFVNDGKTMPMSVSFKQTEKFINDGKWTVSDNEDATVVGGVVVCVNEHHDITTDADVAEVDDIVPVVTPSRPPRGEAKSEESDPTPTLPKGGSEKPKVSDPTPTLPKGGSEKPKTKAKTNTNPTNQTNEGGKYVYATYTTSKGKTGAKITGLSESDAAYQQAAEIHSSGSYTKDKDGNKQFFLCFGPRYAAAAKDVCKAMNDGKSFEDCKAIIDKATEERAAKREEWKQKRAERKASEPADDKEQEMFQLFKKFMAGDKDAMKKVGAMVKAA